MTKLPNHIEEYFADTGNKESESAQVLFKGRDDHIEQMTELNTVQIESANALLHNDQYLAEFGIQQIFTPYVKRFFKLQVSKERKSRGEYVQVHKAELEREQLLSGVSRGGLP